MCVCTGETVKEIGSKGIRVNSPEEYAEPFRYGVFFFSVKYSILVKILWVEQGIMFVNSPNIVRNIFIFKMKIHFHDELDLK